MRRRSSGFRRSRASKFARKRLAWSRALFGTTMDLAGAPPDLLELVLFDPLNDVVPTATVDFHRTWTVKRIIAKGQHVYVPQYVAFSFTPYNLTSALYVIDREDADSTIVATAAGDILEGGADRVLYTDVNAGVIQEMVGTQQAETHLQGPRIDVDWRGNVKCGLDQLVVLGFQFATDQSASLTAWTPTFVSSVLFEAT